MHENYQRFDELHIILKKMSKPHVKYEIAHEQILWFGKNALEEIKIIF